MKVIRKSLFLVCVVVLYGYMDAVFRQKDSRIEVIRSFYADKHPEDAYDVLAFGPSYVYCTVNPIQLYRDTGLRSYVPGTATQPVEMTYHYIRMALRKYRPQLIVLGTSMFVFHRLPVKYQEGYAHQATDPFPLGGDKIWMVSDQRLQDSMENYLFPFFKYHSRWKGLRMNDFSWEHIPPSPQSGLFMGFQMNFGCRTNQISSIDFSKENCSALQQCNIEYLKKIVGLCKQNGVRLLLFNSPRSSALADGRLTALHRLTKEMDLDFLDLNEVFADTGINNHADYHDREHMNFLGAEKATRYLGEYIQKHYGLTVCHSPEERKKWDSLCRRYDDVKKSLMPNDEAGR